MKTKLKNGYELNQVINGCWQLSQGHALESQVDFKDTKKAFYELCDRGLDAFDCADIYTGVEEFIGEFIKESGRNVKVHTKYVPDLDCLEDVSFEFTEQIIDRSLKRLNKESLEIVQFHWWDYEVPGAVDVAGHLVRLQEKGKIQNIGSTNFDTKNLKKLIDAKIPVMSVQAQYSMFDRRPEKELADYCESQDIALLCYGTLSGGFLSDKYVGKGLVKADNRSQVKYLQVIEDTVGAAGYEELLNLLSTIGKKYNASVSNIATKYILSKKAVKSAIIGVRSSKHVESNLALFNFELALEDVHLIDRFLSQYEILPGEPFELERTVGSKYRNIMKMNINEEEQK